MKTYKITYEFGGYSWTAQEKGMDSIDAKKRFERRTGLVALECIEA